MHRLVHCLLLGALLSCLGGCATTVREFGTHARYSPAFDGYVMAKDQGSDDPGEGDTTLLLRDPLTGNKLRCREDVVGWRELYEDIATDHVHDKNVSLAVDVTTGVVFTPLLIAYPVGGLVLAEAVLANALLDDLLQSDDAAELLAGAIGLFKRERFRQAAMVVERALAKDAAVGITDRAYLYLGLSHAKLGNKPRARLALSMFIDRAAVRDVRAYRQASTELKKLGVAPTSCASREPVQLRW